MTTPKACSSSVLAPAIKYAGGKRWLVPLLRAIYLRHRSKTLVEPFVGGMSVALGLQPERAILNDANPHLINLYNQMQLGLRINIPVNGGKELYLMHREKFNRAITANRIKTNIAAQRYYYLLKKGFNGLSRFSQAKGHFNVPPGDKLHTPLNRDLTAYRPVLRQWTISCGDFDKVQVPESCFMYIDPPYDASFTHYDGNQFSWDDQVRLVNWLKQFNSPKIISNHATPRIIELYKQVGMTIYTLEAPRMISCNGNREKAIEVFAVKHISLNPSLVNRFQLSRI